MDLQDKNHDELIEMIQKLEESIKWASRNTQQIAFSQSKEQTVLNKLIELNPYAIAFWHKEGYFLSGNPAYVKMFRGCPPREYSLWNDPIIQNSGQWDEFKRLQEGMTLKFSPLYYNPHDLNPDFPDNPICFKTVVFPIVDNKKEIETLVFIYDDVTEEKKLEEQSKQQQVAIEESNITLRNLISRIEEEKNNLQESIALNLEKNCKPILNQLKENFPEANAEFELLERKMSGIISSFYKRLVTSKFSLTPAEIKICEMIKEGYSGKEIASLLNISYSTVHNHKQHIRHKLGLRNTKTNLRNYLMRF
ncbi:LuxR C-terminal-related transcriptional regulator [bacterium]|nr:LuxR C-terminal-related transcriptional regulator [bacterium]